LIPLQYHQSERECEREKQTEDEEIELTVFSLNLFPPRSYHSNQAVQSDSFWTACTCFFVGLSRPQHERTKRESKEDKLRHILRMLETKSRKTVFCPKCRLKLSFIQLRRTRNLSLTLLDKLNQQSQSSLIPLGEATSP
jgi:hypothetical protein